ncbi:DUF6180 family protein [Lysobacter sp. Root690]|uniref:DUF6180 family protein n=1 Tax=Lysobacter sp. Root690 TaxID=1736588 RepID=UPI000AB52BBC|nr:DUF6180 family protein [Lysobacter sp. Root690]
MNLALPLLGAALLLGSSTAALAQENNFNVTYHVERTPAARLSLDTCSGVVTKAAQRAGLRANSQSTPGKLVTVVGGSESSGTFVVHCIAVDDKTVSVVQGIDYQPQKGALGRFADQAFAALKAAVK